MSERVVGLTAWARRCIDPCTAVVLSIGDVLLGIPDRTGPPAVAVDGLCMVGVCVLVWWRRRFPVSVAVAAGVLLLIPSFDGGGVIVGDGAVSDPASAASFLIALALGSQVLWARSLLGLLPLAAGSVVPAGPFNPFPLMITIGPWLAGLVLASRQRADQLARRARELADEREMFTAASVRYERARIARELHDVVAHGLSLMVVQANAGAYLAGTDADGAAEAFDAISVAADQTRADLDRLATLLDATTSSGQTALELLDELVRRARTAGLDITYQVCGTLDHLTAHSADALHRVIQEAITNCASMHPGAAITVGVRGGDAGVEVEVHNPAAPIAPTPAAGLGRTGGGHGLGPACASGSSRALMLTTFDSDEYVYAALRAGASGFLLKDVPSEYLVTAVRCAARGDALIDPAVTRRLIQRFVHAARPSSDLPPQLAALTPRERDVLRQVVRGLSNAEIAEQLVIEENTVKTHVARILTKLGLRDRVQAVVLAYETGFVTPRH